MANFVDRSASSDCVRNVMLTRSRSRAIIIDTGRDESNRRQLYERNDLFSGV